MELVQKHFPILTTISGELLTKTQSPRDLFFSQRSLMNPPPAYPLVVPTCRLEDFVFSLSFNFSLAHFRVGLWLSSSHDRTAALRRA